MKNQFLKIVYSGWRYFDAIPMIKYKKGIQNRIFTSLISIIYELFVIELSKFLKSTTVLSLNIFELDIVDYSDKSS